MAQRTAVSMWPMQVPSAPTGVVGNGHQPGCCGEVTGAREGTQVTGTDEQRGAEERTEAGYRLDDRGLRMLIEGGGDLRVKALHPLVESEDVGGQFGDDARSDVLAG